MTETRQVRGGTEQYYRRSARRFSFTGDGAHENKSVALQAVAADLQTADEPLLKIRNLRLTADQATQVAARLEQLVEDLQDAGPGEARHGVVIAVYRPRN